MYCQGRERKTISRGSSANLTFKSLYRVACISALAAEETAGGKAPGAGAREAGTPLGARSYAESGGPSAALKACCRATGSWQQRKNQRV